jgi:hypothetical protein
VNVSVKPGGSSGAAETEPVSSAVGKLEGELITSLLS